MFLHQHCTAKGYDYVYLANFPGINKYLICAFINALLFCIRCFSLKYVGRYVNIFSAYILLLMSIKA